MADDAEQLLFKFEVPLFFSGGKLFLGDIPAARVIDACFIGRRAVPRQPMVAAVFGAPAVFKAAHGDAIFNLSEYGFGGLDVIGVNKVHKSLADEVFRV